MEAKAMEEQKATFKERKYQIQEEKRRIMKEAVMNKKLEQEQEIMFMDTHCLDDEQKAYVSAMPAQILAWMGGFGGGASGGNGGV
ncbi:hypothetical protein BAE44_0005717 [Dichanthelium oligosanthes]|uniref:No apical meristem-associated C-terminal domain-containing protein n=1 Tax=Dichanthelium oligosanthes TaxID=888268 RepID=A0A1E5W7A7_9POAL|nr:hypothetical protein BAE44_0005717 [Dichanthelium oligosanthes]